MNGTAHAVFDFLEQKWATDGIDAFNKILRVFHDKFVVVKVTVETLSDSVINFSFTNIARGDFETTPEFAIRS